MTLPNKLTLLRVFLTFVTMGLLFTPGWVAKASAFACFTVASLTDWLDGWLARRWNQRTPLGALLDPIADKVLVLGLFLAFIQLRLVPAWMVLIILLRELVITGVRLFAASRQLVLSAAREGKHKTISQMVAIIVVLGVVWLREGFGPSGWGAGTDMFFRTLILGCMWITVILTVISGASFFWRHRAVLFETVTR